MFEYLFFKLGWNLAKISDFKTIYKISDFIYLLIYKVFKYRLKVVRQNLRLAFPDYTEKQLNKIEKDFYHHLADLFVETFKFYTLDKQSLKQRIIIENADLLNQYYYAGQNVILAGAHIGNWELGPLVAPFWFKHQFVILYKPLKNSKIDEKIKQARTRFGSRLISIDITARGFTKGNKPYCVVMLADQNPGNTKKALWIRFFNIPTATLHGLETYSKLYNLPIFYFDMDKVERGKYKAKIEPLVHDPRNQPKGAITKKYMERVEQSIREKPHLWLWSHRRWKHQYDPQKHTLID